MHWLQAIETRRTSVQVIEEWNIGHLVRLRPQGSPTIGHAREYQLEFRNRVAVYRDISSNMNRR